MKKTLFALFVVCIIVVLYFLKDYSTNEQNTCIHITTPIEGTTLSFPLTITGTIDYACRPIFEAEAGYATIQYNGQDISSVSADNGIVTVIGEYYEASYYPVSRATTIQSINENYSGPVDLVISPTSPCGDSPECPPLPAPVIIPVTLP